MIELNEFCIPVIPSRIRHIKKCCDYLVVHPSKPLWTIVNKTGFEILKLCNGKRSLHDIGLILSSRNKIALQTVLNDLLRFFKELSKTGFLFTTNESLYDCEEKSQPIRVNSVRTNSKLSPPLTGRKKSEVSPGDKGEGDGSALWQTQSSPWNILSLSKDTPHLTSSVKEKEIISEQVVKPFLTVDRLLLHVTSKCNYKCKHCYFPDGFVKGRELSTEEIYSVIDQFISQGGKNLALSGGEPLLRKDIKDILKYASLKLQISLLTNGSMLNEELIDLFKKIDISIQISIDGSCAAINDSIRGDGYFKKAMSGIDLLRNNGLTDRLIICSTIMEQNIGDLPNIIKLAEKLNIALLRFLPLRKEGRGKDNWNEINGRLGRKDYIRFYKYIYDLIVNKKVGVGIQSGLSGIAITFSHDDIKKGMWCNIGRELTISSNGNVYPCPLLMKDEFLLGNIMKINLEEIKASKKFNDIHNLCLERQNLIEKCKRCIWKNFCRAGCAGMALMNKNTMMDTDFFCEFRKKLYEDIIFSLAKDKKGTGEKHQMSLLDDCFF